MKINKIMMPMVKGYYSDKELLYMYFDKIIDMESLSKTQYGKLIGVDIRN